MGVWTAAKRTLEAAGIESPVIDARMLVEAAVGVTRTQIITDPQRLLTDEQSGALQTMVRRRLNREPVSQILGAKGFWKIMLKVTRDVLTPRPETETILDVVLPALDEESPARILDLGVGSGAILLAILAERPAASGVGVDISVEALVVAQENAATLGLGRRVELRHGDWTSGLEGERFDVVVCNPPYVRSGDIEGLQPEVRDHEPRLALDGGDDGLAAFRLLAEPILRVLTPGGLFALEVGEGQAHAVQGLMDKAGAGRSAVQNDLSLKARVVWGRKKGLDKARADG